MSEPTMEEIEARQAAVDPWVEFIAQESDEVGEYWTSLQEVIASAMSANEWDHVDRLLTMLEELVANAKNEATHGGWVEEMCERQQQSYERWAAQFTPEALAKANRKSPREQLADLLAS